MPHTKRARSTSMRPLSKTTPRPTRTMGMATRPTPKASLSPSFTTRPTGPSALISASAASRPIKKSRTIQISR